VASDRAQKNELAKLRVKVKEAETVTEQLDRAIEHVTDLETENQVLKQQVAKLKEQTVGEAAAQQSGGEITYQSYNQEVMAELNRLLPFEAEVQRLREQLLAKEEELTRLKSERVAKTGGQKDAGYAEEATRLKIQLDLKQKDNLKLRSQVASLAALVPGKPTPKLRTRDAATDQAADQPPPLYLPTDVVELQKILEEKEAQIALMGQQLQKFEKTTTDLTKLIHHTKGQSQLVKELRQQLARAEVSAISSGKRGRACTSLCV